MNEYIYPTWTRYNNEWVRDMLNDWRKSKLPYLCFPWIKTKVHTLLSQEPFWMYMYYAIGRTDVPSLQGKMEFRVRVIDWGESRFRQADVYPARFDEDGRIWFKCDKFEEIVKGNNAYVSLDDFRHANNKNLISTLRNSIPPVVYEARLKIIQQYGAD